MKFGLWVVIWLIISVVNCFFVVVFYGLFNSLVGIYWMYIDIKCLFVGVNDGFIIEGIVIFKNGWDGMIWFCYVLYVVFILNRLEMKFIILFKIVEFWGRFGNLGNLFKVILSFVSVFLSL